MKLMIRYDISTMADLDEIVALHDQYLNFGDGVRPYIEESLDSTGVIALKAIDESGNIAGLIIYTQGIALSGGHPDLCEKIKEITKSALVYTGDAFLVVREMRHLGIADALCKMALKEFKKKASDLGETVYLLHELWVYKNMEKVIPAERVVNDVYGVTHDLGIYEDFYRDFHLKGFICPICGPCCICSAKLLLCGISGKGS